jgi:hypothetical protein
MPPRPQQTAALPRDYPGGYAEVPAPASAPVVNTAPRWPWALAAVALVAILGALVYAVWPRSEPSPPRASATTSTSRPAVTAATTTPTTPGTTAVTSTPPLPSPAVTFDAMRDVVTGFYSDLPGNPMAAWDKLDIHYQQRNGMDDYLGFWNSIQSVALLSVTPRDDTSVIARIRYVLNNGQVDTEDRWLSVVPAGGRLLIYDSERIGPA